MMCSDSSCHGSLGHCSFRQFSHEDPVGLVSRVLGNVVPDSGLHPGFVRTEFVYSELWIWESCLCLRSLDWFYFQKTELTSSVYRDWSLRWTSLEVLIPGPAEPPPAGAGFLHLVATLLKVSIRNCTPHLEGMWNFTVSRHLPLVRQSIWGLLRCLFFLAANIIPRDKRIREGGTLNRELKIHDLGPQCGRRGSGYCFQTLQSRC